MTESIVQDKWYTISREEWQERNKQLQERLAKNRLNRKEKKLLSNTNNTMWFGTTSSNNAYWIKIRGLKKGEPEAYFEVKKGEDLQTASYVEGHITKLEASGYEFEGKFRNTFNLTLQDDEGSYILQSAFTNIGRTILNSLAGAEQLGDIKLSLYINKKGFKSVWVENNGERTEWKYPIDEQMDMVEEVKNKAGEVLQKDYSALEQFYIDTVIPKIANKLDIVQQVEQVEEREDEDIPFS